MDNNNPISNPFDEDEQQSSTPMVSVFDNNNGMSPLDDGGSNRRPIILLSVGLIALCCGAFAVGGFLFYKPDPQALLAQYFPSSTPTASATATPSPTPSVTP